MSSIIKQVNRYVAAPITSRANAGRLITVSLPEVASLVPLPRGCIQTQQKIDGKGEYPLGRVV